MNRFIRAATQGENHWAFYGFTILLILLAFFLGQIPIGQIISYKVSNGTLTPSMLQEFNSTYDFAILGLPTYAGLILMLLGPILATGVLCISIVFVHKRALKSVFTSRKSVDLGRVFFAFGLWIVLSLLAEVVMYNIFPGHYSFNVNYWDWLPLLIVALFLLPIQTTFEEIFIRGYLLQGIALVTRSKWVVIAVTTLIFGMMHLGNPEVREFGLGIMGLYYISVALFLIIITILDDGLELALGIHAATNVYGATIVSFDGSVLQTDTLIQISHLNPVWMIALFFGMMLLFVIIVTWKYKMQRFSSLFERIELIETEEISSDI